MALMDMLEARAIDFHHAAMMAALGVEYVYRTAAACHVRSAMRSRLTVPSPTAYLAKHKSLTERAREDCTLVKIKWSAWFLEMQSINNLSLEPVYYANMEEAQAEAARLDNELLRAWASLRVISKRCGPELMTSPLAGRRILIGLEQARLYALRNIFTD